jgi:hypothetical protein
MMGLEDPIGYFAFVDTLQKNVWDTDLQSAARRTIISRLYYGVFHHIKLKLFGINDDRGITHNRLKAEVQKLAIKKGLDINIKDHLSDFEKKRVIADYKRLRIIDEKFLQDTFVIFQIIQNDCEKIWG